MQNFPKNVCKLKFSFYLTVKKLKIKSVLTKRDWVHTFFSLVLLHFDFRCISCINRRRSKQNIKGILFRILIAFGFWFIWRRRIVRTRGIEHSVADTRTWWIWWGHVNDVINHFSIIAILTQWICFICCLCRTICWRTFRISKQIW